MLQIWMGGDCDGLHETWRNDVEQPAVTLRGVMWCGALWCGVVSLCAASAEIDYSMFL